MANDMNLQISIAGTNDSGPAFESMNSAIASAQEALNSLTKASQSASEAFSRIGQVGQETGRAVESGMQAAQQGVRNTGEAINTTSSSVDRLGQALSAEMIGEQLKNIGETGMHAFEGMVHAAADFEYNISRIGAVLTTSGKATSGQMQQMSADALKLGSNSSFSANQIAEGMYTLARQGLDATTILGDGVNGAINVVNDLAQATDSSVTDTATVITDVVHEYGLSGAALRDVANTMSGALHNSSESLDDFYQSMKQVGPIAANLHQNALDMSTALALLAQHGITGSSAGTALKNMLLGLEPHTKKAAELMKDLGISAKNGAADSFYQLNGNLKPLPEILDILNQKFGGLNDAQKQAALSTTFTKYGLAGLNVVVGESRDKFLAFQNELKKDDAATIAAKKMDNLHGDLLKFNAGVQTMMKSFGDSINGMLRPIVQGASEAIKWITQLPKPIKEMGMAFFGIGSALAIAGGSIIAFAGAVKMLGPTLEMAGMSTAGLEAAAGGLGAIFTGVLIPITAVVAVVAAVGLGFKLAYDHIKPFHDLVNQVMARLKTFAQTLASAILPVFKNVFNAMSKTAVEVFNTLKTTIGNGLKTVYEWWMQYWPEIKQVFQEVWAVMRALIAPCLAAIETAIVAAIGFIKGSWNNGWNAIKAVLQVVWDAIKGTIQTAWHLISGIISTGLDLLTGHWGKAWGDLKSTFSNVWNDIKSMFGNLINDAATFGSNFVHAIANGITGSIGSVVNAASSVVNSVKSFISGGISGAVSAAKSAFGVAAHASGGIFTHPHVGLVAEAGPEAIIPLSDPTRGLQLWQQAGQALGVLPGSTSSGFTALPSGGGGGTVYNITINASGNITRNERELGDIVSKAILNKVKMQGKI